MEPLGLNSGCKRGAGPRPALLSFRALSKIFSWWPHVAHSEPEQQDARHAQRQEGWLERRFYRALHELQCLRKERKSNLAFFPAYTGPIYIGPYLPYDCAVS